MAEIQNNKVHYSRSVKYIMGSYFVRTNYFISLSPLIASMLFPIIKRKNPQYIFFNTNIVRISMLGKILKDSPIDYMFYQSLAQIKPILITLGSKKSLHRRNK